VPLPKSLTQPLRQGQLNVGSGWRAYFAPFNQQYAVNQPLSVLGPTLYDLQITGKFIDGNSGPPAGWFDLGYVKNFKFTPQSKTGNVTTGYRGVIRAKYRAEVGEKLAFQFGESSRMAYRIASGTQVFNLLSNAALTSTSGPLSASGASASAMAASGYQATGITATATAGLPTLFVPSGSGAAFAAGDMIVVDQDYNGTSYGFVGDSGANVFPGLVTDVDFIRKTSDYVATVSSVVTGVAGMDALILTSAFVGGGNDLLGAPNHGPTTGAKIQKIQGWVAREGGTMIAEWSGIFVLDTVDASQIMLYYPRISPDTFGGLPATNLQNATSLQTYDLEASFDALAFDDPLDGETVVRYCAYFPHTGVTAQI
jgi:hypothetical protein